MVKNVAKIVTAAAGIIGLAWLMGWAYYQIGMILLGTVE